MGTKKSGPDENELYVGNIPVDASEQDLWKLILDEKVHGVKKVTMGRKKKLRGCEKKHAFLRVENEESVSGVIDKLNNKDLEGNRITVCRSNNKEAEPLPMSTADRLREMVAEVEGRPMKDLMDPADENGGETGENSGGRLSDAYNEIDELIRLCDEIGFVKVVRTDKHENFRWQVGVTDMEYAFVTFLTEELASEAKENLEKNGLEKKEISLSKDKKTLFTGNVPWKDLKEAVEEASIEIFKLHHLTKDLMDDKGKKPADEHGGEAGESSGGQLSAASKEIEKLKREVGFVNVVSNGKRKNFRWQVGEVTDVEYAFVSFRTEELASQADQNLDKNYLQEKNILVSFTEDKKTLFIGNVQQDGLNVAVEQAGPKILEVHLAMMEIMDELSVMRYTIGGREGHREFIEALRKKLAMRKEDGSIECITVSELSAAVLPKLSQLKERDRLLHIELHAKNQTSKETWTTTLALRKDNLYIVGFTGKDGKWFELAEGGCPLPKEYHATPLHWNVRYRSIMNLNDQDQVKQTLSKTGLGMAFAMRAVRRISQYPVLDYNDENLTRLGLAGLIVLICESARIEPILKEFQSSEWGRPGGKGVLINKDVLDYIWKWGTMSKALMRWKKHDYKEEFAGEFHLRDALGLRLVHNSEDLEGGTRVEIFTISANFDVTCMTVTDNVNTNGRIIYNQDVRQMEQVPAMRKEIFMTGNLLQQTCMQIFKKVVEQFSQNASKVDLMMGPKLQNGKIGLIIIIRYHNQTSAKDAWVNMFSELDKQVTMSWKYPTTKAKGKKLRVTSTKTKLFITGNLLEQDCMQYFQKAVNQFSAGASEVVLTMGQGLTIIIQYYNQTVAEDAWRKMSGELDKEVTISREYPRIKAKGMDNLELSALREGISGYKWFDIEVEHAIPHSIDAVDTELVTRSIPWRFDCRKQDSDATELLTRNIFFDSELKMVITYMMMSDAVKATLEVKLQRLGNPYWLLQGCTPMYETDCTVHGEIAACIDGFDHRIVLFRIHKMKAITLARGSTLPLERSHVWMPRGKRLHIEMKHLRITAGDQEVSIPDSLSFDFGDLSPSSGANDSEIKLNVTWDDIPQKKITVKPDDNDKVQWVVGDDAREYTERIEDLRTKLAEGNPRHEHVPDPEDDKRPDLKDLSKRPILAKLGDIEAKRCVHIELQTGAGKETWSTTLAVRDDNCAGVGFMNQSGVWYEFGYLWGYGQIDWILPAQYNSVNLCWGARYNQILQGTDWDWEEVRSQLNTEGLGKKFVMNAVHTLSRYPDLEDYMNPRLAVVGLMIVFCESAKLDLLCKSFARNWNTRVELTVLLTDYILAWPEMSRTLLRWKDHFYRRWPQNSGLELIGITSPKDALDAVHLVFNHQTSPYQIDVIYTIGDEEGYTKFINELRSIVMSHPYREDVSPPAGVLPRPGDEPMWWNIQLQVAYEEASITLALRGDNLCICGFRSQKDNIWYQVDYDRMFGQKYNAFPLSTRYGHPIFSHLSLYHCPCGESAAGAAVRQLSQYSYHYRYQPALATDYYSQPYDEDITEFLWGPLGTLQLMVCYSASIINVHDAVQKGWLEWMQADQNLRDFISFWNDMSISALQEWRQCRGNSRWDHDERLERIGIRSPEDAEKAFALIKDAPEVQGGEIVVATN